MRWLLLVIANLGVLAVLLAIFEVGSALLLPKPLVSALWPYQCESCDPPPLVGRRTFPQSYFASHSDRGFDITARFERAIHWVDGVRYFVWSNAFGCFDQEQAPGRDYIYLAGDSFAWGFAPFDLKFGTLLERSLDVRVVKCGVPHTGQSHQLAKAREVIERLGPPSIILVAHYPNDVCNDLAYPHSKVIEGWLVDDKALARRSGEWVAENRSVDRLETLLRSGAAAPREASFFDDLIFKLKAYSVSANIVAHIYAVASQRLQSETAPQLDGIYLKGLCDGAESRDDAAHLASNHEALLAFKQYTADLGARLVIALIPPKPEKEADAPFRHLIKMLEQQGVDHIDLTAALVAAARNGGEIYWDEDPHLNIAGNRIVAKKLASFLRPLLAQSR